MNTIKRTCPRSPAWNQLLGYSNPVKWDTKKNVPDVLPELRTTHKVHRRNLRRPSKRKNLLTSQQYVFFFGINQSHGLGPLVYL